MRTPLLGMKARLRAGIALATGLVAAVGLAAFAVTAGAAPQPTVADVQAQVNRVTSQFDQINQEYDKIAQQAAQASAKLAAVDKQVAANQVQFTKLRGAVAQIAAESYEEGDTTSVAGLLTSNNPNDVLSRASLLLEISGSRDQQMRQFLAAAQQLKNSQQQAQRTKDALTALQQQASQKKQHAGYLVAQAKAALATLTAQQQQTVQAAAVGGGGPATTAAYTGPTASQGGKAAAFAVAEAQAACPYVYGSAGPCSAGYDCSGLAEASWASASVSIPRTTYEDWAQLPHISLSALEPGDLILYDSEGHVAIYVGNGMIVDAPHTGADVEEISMNEDWYAQNTDGAVRP